MKRKTLIVAVAVCLAAILALGSLAVFSNSDDITNKFMVAGYDPEDPITPDELFSVTVYETDKDGNQTEQGLTYDGIQPGDKLDKDPTVKNTGKYDQYVRVMVTVTNAKNWMGGYYVKELATDEHYSLSLSIHTAPARSHKEPPP